MDKTLIPITTGNQPQKVLQITPKTSALKKRHVKTWTLLQDQRLVAFHQMHPKKWNIIAQKMKNRNENQCLHRFRRICRLGQNKKIWSQHEDEVVLRMISEVGHNWRVIAHELGTKSGKQIRQRFINKLDPNIRREEWTEEEDMKIIELYSRIGSKWCEISKCLPGRPENKIKNRFYSYIQKNYEFKIKEGVEQMEGEKQNMKQRVVHKQLSSLQLQKRRNSIGILQERKQNSVCGQDEQVVKQQVKQEHVSYSRMEEEKQNNNQEYNSLKEINEECFFSYKSNGQNGDLLYFEDN